MLTVCVSAKSYRSKKKVSAGTENELLLTHNIRKFKTLSSRAVAGDEDDLRLCPRVFFLTSFEVGGETL